MIKTVYDAKEIALLKRQFVETDPRTWPFFPIIMPLFDGKGPAMVGFDEITFEVWDQFCIGTYFSTKYLPEAISHAMKMNKELFDDTARND